jgi:hypothetical protein
MPRCRSLWRSTPTQTRRGPGGVAHRGVGCSPGVRSVRLRVTSVWFSPQEALTWQLETLGVSTVSRASRSWVASRRDSATEASAFGLVWPGGMTKRTVGYLPDQPSDVWTFSVGTGCAARRSMCWRMWDRLVASAAAIAVLRQPWR